MFSRICKYTWRDYFIFDMDDPELLEELEWAQSRTTIEHKAVDGRELSKYEQALSKFEFDNYLVYIQKWPGCCYMVGQSAHDHPQRSGTATKGMLWERAFVRVTRQAGPIGPGVVTIPANRASPNISTLPHYLMLSGPPLHRDPQRAHHHVPRASPLAGCP